MFKPTFGAQEHRREMRIDDVDLLKHDTMKNQRAPRGSGDLRALFETFQCPVGALLGHSWGTVGAYPFDMLKKAPKQRHCSKTASGRRMPEPGGNLE